MQQNSKATLINDIQLADRLSMKPPTIRSQRFRRLHGLDHWLTLDPVYIGSKPRYRLADVEGWITQQGRTNTRQNAAREG